MSIVATTPLHRSCPRRKRRRLEPDGSQTRRARRLDRKRRRRQAHQARAARRRLEHIYRAVPQPARAPFASLVRALPGHPSSYHRVFSQRRWSSWRLAQRLAGWVFDHLVPEGRVFLAGDDTVEEHPGPKVFGKGCHRDPVRSTHSYTAFRWGHKWVVLAVLARFPFSHRPWAPPLLVALYHSEA